MKKHILFCLFPLFSSAQFTENFDAFSGWQADTNHFIIDSLNRLQLMAPQQTGDVIIWHSSASLMQGAWELDIIMDFNPSSSNYTNIHLSSDNLGNGYFVKLGGTEDAVSLYKMTNGDKDLLISGITDFLDSSFVEINLLATRDSIGHWRLDAKYMQDSTYTMQGQCVDDSHLTSQRFGIECKYTSTRYDKFFFDNIRVEGYSFVDTFLYPKASDIVINEVLFNPIEGDNDFVEIINRSEHPLCVRGLQLANYYANKPSNFKIISEQYTFLQPKEIVVLCKSKETLLNYHPDAIENQIMELESMPAFNNDQGVVVLALDSNTLDEFHYDENMHFDLLQEIEGVSLERINTENSQWHSASEQSGFSTPTLVNSQAQLLTFANEVMSISPQIITPNNDGQDDILNIQVAFPQSGYRGQLIIFNSQGFPIKTLVNNELFGTKNTYFWDGLTERAEAAKTGRYILWLEATHPSRPPIIEKQSSVVGWY